MSKLLTIIFSTILLISCGNHKELDTIINTNTDWSKLNLIGDVKSYRETKFLAVNDFSIIEDGEKKPHVFNKEILFNLDGFKIEMNEYMPDGNLTCRTMYLYQNGNLKEYNCYDFQGSPFKIGKYEYKDNKIEKLVDNSSDGRHNWTKKYSYNNTGNIAEVVQYKSEEIIDSKEIYIYDENNNMIESDFYKADELITKNNHSYDEDGNITELKYGETNLYSYKYSYDFKGNWVKKIVYENNEPSGIIFREIEYFD